MKRAIDAGYNSSRASGLDLAQDSHQPNRVGLLEHALHSKTVEVGERRLVEQFRVHDSPFGQMIDHQIEELELIGRELPAGKEVRKRALGSLPVEPDQASDELRQPAIGLERFDRCLIGPRFPRARRIDVRVIAATNRDLLREVAEARFREDLFFRLAVLVLKLPPLRQRTGDLVPLIDGLLGRINAESASEPDFVEKKLAVGARNVLLQHAWPGNVRELQNTLRRAAVWSEGATIQKSDIEEALLTFPPAGQKADAILAQPIDQGVDLKALMHKVASHYLEQAMKASGGNKTRAAELVGLPNYQTFSNWLSKYGRA